MAIKKKEQPRKLAKRKLRKVSIATETGEGVIRVGPAAVGLRILFEFVSVCVCVEEGGGKGVAAKRDETRKSAPSWQHDGPGAKSAATGCDK